MKFALVLLVIALFGTVQAGMFLPNFALNHQKG